MPDDVAKLQAILFSQPGFVDISDLQKNTKMRESDIRDCLKKLKKYLTDSGLELIEHTTSYQLAVSSRFAQDVQLFQHKTAPTLSQAALEVLAIVAYNQPVSKSQIEQIRGVSSDQSIKGLLARKLIIEIQNASKTQIVYKTTGKLLTALGLASIKQLPKLQ